MIMDQLERLKGQSVEVVYNTIIYRGVLIGASEEEVFLQTPMQWVSLPLEGITEVRKAPD
jgi:hypothetical protein